MIFKGSIFPSKPKKKIQKQPRQRIFTDSNGQTYQLNDNFAIIQPNCTSKKIEIFPTLNINNKEYEVKFPDNCNKLFKNNIPLKEFILHKLLHPTTNIINTRRMFNSCISLKELDLSNLDTSNILTMEGMFFSCLDLNKVNVSSFNTSNVLNMSDMFCNTIQLTELDLSNFDTSNVNNMDAMFCSIEIPILDLSNFDTSNVRNFNQMFSNSDCNEIIMNFNTKNARTMMNMFSGCKNLTNVNLTNFDLRNTTNIMNMFCGCKKLRNLDVSSLKIDHIKTSLCLNAFNY